MPTKFFHKTNFQFVPCLNIFNHSFLEIDLEYPPLSLTRHLEISSQSLLMFAMISAALIASASF